jgi:hypothetical protein
VAIFGHENALHIVAREVGIELPQLVGVELVPSDAVVRAFRPRSPLASCSGSGRQAVPHPLHQVLGAGVLRQRCERLDALVQEHAERVGLMCDLPGRTGPDEAKQSRRRGGQVAQSHYQWTERVGQLLRHVADDPRHRHRHDRRAVCLRSRKLAVVRPTIPAPMTPIVFLPAAVAVIAALTSSRLPAILRIMTDKIKSCDPA